MKVMTNVMSHDKSWYLKPSPDRLYHTWNFIKIIILQKKIRL